MSRKPQSLARPLQPCVRHGKPGFADSVSLRVTCSSSQDVPGICVIAHMLSSFSSDFLCLCWMPPGRAARLPVPQRGTHRPRPLSGQDGGPGASLGQLSLLLTGGL